MHFTNSTKEKIFYAATELFAEKGYSNVSMREIAKEVNIKAASIYNHFSSKEQILETLFDYYLSRMDEFYDKLDKVSSNLSADEKLEDLLKQLMFSYEPDELKIMYELTRLVTHEQFRSHKAADALVGSGYRKYMEKHVLFFDRLSDLGLIKGKERNHMYGELFARISLTFTSQLLHPEITPTLKDQSVLYSFIIPLIVNYEQDIAND